MAAQPRRLKLFFPLYFTVFLDMLGIAIVYPIFLPVLLDPEAHFFALGTLDSVRIKTVSILLMSYPLMQFLSAPLIGAISDRIGRYPTLLVSIVGLAISYGLCAFALQMEHLVWLFAGRAIGGIFSGNISLCLSSIADVIPQEKRRSKYFGYVSFLSGLAFIVGPFFGGVMSNGSWGLNPATPFWIVTFLAVVDFICAFMLFEETLAKLKKTAFSLLDGVRDIFRASSEPKLRRLFLFYFLFLLSMEIVFLFLSGLLDCCYKLSRFEIGLFFAYTGLLWTLGTSLLNTLMLKWGSPSKIILLSMVVCLISMLLLSSHSSFVYFAASMGLASIGFSILWPNTYAIISKNASKQIQGKAMGISGSMSALAAIFASYIGGLWFNSSPRVLFLGSMGIMGLACVVFLWNIKKSNVSS
jgi:MFS transporter, DHA1 family, tetracycline resistance protein